MYDLAISFRAIFIDFISLKVLAKINNSTVDRVNSQSIDIRPNIICVKAIRRTLRSIRKTLALQICSRLYCNSISHLVVILVKMNQHQKVIKYVL